MRVGRVAGNSGQHSVSPAPSSLGEPGGFRKRDDSTSRVRLDRPAAYTPHALMGGPTPLGLIVAEWLHFDWWN